MNNFQPPSQNQFFSAQSPPLPPSSKPSLFGSQTAVIIKPPNENIIDEIDTAIYEIPYPPKLELDDFLNALGRETVEILKDDFVSDKSLEEKTIEKIKEEYNFDEMKLRQCSCSDGDDNEEFIEACNLLLSDDDNRDFIPFLCSDVAQNIMTNNSLSIHVDSGNICYQNFNINEHFYVFLQAQQEESKRPIPKIISYHHSFEKYIKSYLPSFSVDDAETFVLFSNKNSKYLSYKFNDWLELAGGQNRLIRYISKSKDDVVLKIIEEKDKQFLIEKVIYNVEEEKPYKITAEKKQKLCLSWKETIQYVAGSTSLCLLVLLILIQYIHTLDPDQLEQMDNDFKANGRQVKSIVEIQDAFELSCTFQMFYYYNG